MSQSEKQVGAIGLVRVGSLEITITPLSQADEMAFDRELRAAAGKAAGDYFTRCKPELDAMAAAGATGDRVEFLREIARMAGRKESLSAVALWDFQNSAAGLPIELWWRGRKATPGLDRAGLAAVITDANADEIAAGLRELLKGDDPN